MRNIIAYLFIASAAATAVPEENQRIIGGAQTSIFTYPSIVALLFGQNNVYRQSCGGCILNTRSVLTAAHCPFGSAAVRWLIRMGSTSSISGGIIHTLQRFTVHPSYNRWTFDNDIAIMRTAAAIRYTSAIRPARIAGASYNLAANQVVWAVGWGATSSTGSVFATNLRRVQISSVNQATCRNNYAAIGRTITANMLCAGRINGGGRSQCRGDDGSPLYHNGVVVGVYSFSQGCGIARFPGVNTRVSRYATWIANNS